MSTELKIDSLDPYEIKKIFFKRTKFKEPPIVIITPYGNYNVNLLKVNEKYFEVENNCGNKIKFNYATFKNTNTTTVNNTQIPDAYLNVSNSNINVDSNNYIVDIDLMQLVDYEMSYNIRFSFNPDQPMLFINENNTISINTEMFFLIDPSDIEINVVATLESNPEISKNILINIHLLQEAYQTINNYTLTYTTDSDLTQYAGYDLSYISQYGQTLAAFFLPDITKTNNTFLKITTDFTNNLNLELYILNSPTSNQTINQQYIPIYLTTNPNDPLTNRVILNNNYNNYTSFDYAVKLFNSKTYYFWFEENDKVWYVSIDSFPNTQ